MVILWKSLIFTLIIVLISSFYLGHIPDAVRAQKEAGNDEVVPIRLIQNWLQQVNSSLAVIFVIHRPNVFTIDPENIKVSY